MSMKIFNQFVGDVAFVFSVVYFSISNFFFAFSVVVKIFRGTWLYIIDKSFGYTDWERGLGRGRYEKI